MSDSTGISLISTLVTRPVTLGSGGYADSLTITNAGEVEGYFHGPCVSGDGTLLNAGLITNSAIDGSGVVLTGGTLINTGMISDVGIRDGYNATIINSGGIGYVGLGNGVIIDSGGIGGGSELPGITAIYGLTLELEPGFGISGPAGLGDLQDVEVKSGNGTLILSAGIQTFSMYGFQGFSKIDIGADTGVTLNASGGWLEKLPSSGTTLAGFQPGDTLQIPDTYRASYVSGEGIILSNALSGTNVATIALSSPPADGLAFTTVAGEVDITAPCFCAGTHIRTPGGYVPVEALRIGDEVCTAFHGPQRIKWIGQRGYEGRFIAGNRNALPVCLKAGAIANGVPSRDLWVSPDHAICEGGVLIHAWRLVNGVSIVQAEAVARVTYFHIELEGHHIVFAEDCPTESFRDTNCRERFANAHEYGALYGETESGEFCLPLMQSGFHLENIRRRLGERAGVTLSILPPGPLRGNLDEAGSERLHGWAQDVSNPEIPVVLTIMADGKPHSLVIANEFRTDLRAAGLGSGCHAFSALIPPGIKQVEIRRASDGTLLTQAPLTRAA